MWYTPYINWAADNGLVNGVGGGRFAPNNEMTNEQMMKMTAGFAKLFGVGESDNSDVALKFDDKALISDWATESVKFCVANGLIENEGSLNPQAKATRADSAMIIARLAKLCDV